jgi:hypothetical protein
MGQRTARCAAAVATPGAAAPPVPPTGAPAPTRAPAPGPARAAAATNWPPTGGVATHSSGRSTVRPEEPAVHVEDRGLLAWMDTVPTSSNAQAASPPPTAAASSAVATTDAVPAGAASGPGAAVMVPPRAAGAYAAAAVAGQATGTVRSDDAPGGTSTGRGTAAGPAGMSIQALPVVTISLPAPSVGPTAV